MLRFQQLEDRVNCAEANLARALEDLSLLRYFVLHVMCLLDSVEFEHQANINISLIPNFFLFYKINDNDCARQKRFQVKRKLNNDSIIGCSFLLNYHCIESQFNINIFIFCSHARTYRIYYI